MARLIFAILWTALAAFLVAATLDQLEGLERALLISFPIFGALFTVASFVMWRRYHSVHTQVCDGTTLYVWTDWDGSEKRSEIDPRLDWDAEGDGDGDGGD